MKNERSELRKFGITMAIVLGVWGSLFLWRGKSFYIYFFSFSVVFLIAGFLRPLSLKFVYHRWKTLCDFVGWLMSRILLMAIFYLVITPVGLLAKLFGRDFLQLRIDKKRDSYWIKKKNKPFQKMDYERQF